MPLVMIREKGQMTLPAKMLRDNRVKAGDVVDVEMKDRKLTVVPQSVLDRALAESQADVEAGRVSETFETLEEGIAHLDAVAAKVKTRRSASGRRRS